MPDDLRETVLHKLRYTPVRDYLRNGFTASLDPCRQVEETSLPIPIKQLIERVVKKSRLWRLEKLDVAAELIGHFADGIASGVSTEDLIQAFGDDTRAAQLIRRSKRRNRPLYWHALRFAVVFMLVVVPPVLFAKTYIENVQWEAMASRVDVLKSNAETRKEKRTVLRSIKRAGNSWDEYAIALGNFDGWNWGRDADSGLLYMYAMGFSDAARQVGIEKAIASNLWRLDHLRQGAERADGQMPYNWYWKSKEPNLISSRLLANLGAAQAKWLAERGRSQEAADILLDVAVFGKDLSTEGPLLSAVGSAVYWTAADGLSRLLVARKFDPATLVHLTRSLETLDREFPRLGSLTSEMARSQGSDFVREFNIHIGDSDWWQWSKALGWRFAISPRGYASAAFTEIDPYLQRFAKLEDVPYSTAKAEAAAMTAGGKKSSNKLVKEEMPDLSQMLAIQREARAKLRLVRAGISVLTTGEMPVIPDPFGTNLLYKKDAKGITIWSLGRDGKNQNGDGEWGQPDISLTIPR